MIIDSLEGKKGGSSNTSVGVFKKLLCERFVPASALVPFPLAFSSGLESCIAGSCASLTERQLQKGKSLVLSHDASTCPHRPKDLEGFQLSR